MLFDVRDAVEKSSATGPSSDHQCVSREHTSIHHVQGNYPEGPLDLDCLRFLESSNQKSSPEMLHVKYTGSFLGFGSNSLLILATQ